MTRIVSDTLQDAIQRLYADLRWTKQQQIGFNRRTCGKSWPQTTTDANKIYTGLEAMLIRRMTPYWPAFRDLVDELCDIAYQLNEWEQGFVLDIRRKIHQKRFISPRMIKKVREAAHKQGIPCGFPSFREMAEEKIAAKDAKGR